jgi:hypothetical protein
MSGLPITSHYNLKDLSTINEIELFLNSEERLDFETNLQWLVSHTTSLLFRLQLQEEGGQSVYSLLEDFLKEWLNRIWCRVLNKVLESITFLFLLKNLASKKGYRFKGMRNIQVYCPGGQRVVIRSPYFLKANSKKKGRKKKGPNGRGTHLGLEILGFVQKVAPNIAMTAVATSVISPSFEIASQLLEKQGLPFSAKQLSRLTEYLGEKFFEKRVLSALEEGETLKGKRVLISVDGGRSRQRKKKRGRKNKGLKRHGYHSNWIEPKLFVISVLEKEGAVEKKIQPFVDGSIEIDDFAQLLEEYLQQLDIQQAKEVLVSGDGAPWIWLRIPQLLINLGVESQNIHEILDYTHAKQNLNALYQMLSKKAQTKISFSQWKNWLWEGNIEAIGENLLNSGKSKATKAYKKFLSYFEKNQKRMKYEDFRSLKCPTGSGVIESAIRRVINLRIKSCGSFWRKDKMVLMIYLRAQFLYGRWDCLQRNLLKTI